MIYLVDSVDHDHRPLRLLEVDARVWIQRPVEHVYASVLLPAVEPRRLIGTDDDIAEAVAINIATGHPHAQAAARRRTVHHPDPGRPVPGQV